MSPRRSSLLLLLFLPVFAGCSQLGFSDVTEYAQAKKETYNSENEVRNLTLRYHEAIDRAEEYRLEVDQVEADLRAVQEELRTLRPKLVAAEKEKSDAEAAQKAAAEATKRLQEEKKGLEKQAADLDAESKKIAADMEATRKAKAELTSKAADLEREAEILEKEQDALRSRVARLRDRANALRGDRTEIDGHLRALDALLEKAGS